MGFTRSKDLDCYEEKKWGLDEIVYKYIGKKLKKDGLQAQVKGKKERKKREKRKKEKEKEEISSHLSESLS